MSRRKQERANRAAERAAAKPSPGSAGDAPRPRARKTRSGDAGDVAPARQALRSARATMDARRPSGSVRFERRADIERPRAPWHPVPVAEILVAIGVVGVIIGLTRGPSRGAVPLLTGIGICTLAVVELTIREHFAGYRSHALLLAFFPVVAIETAVATLSQNATVARIALIPEGVLFVLLFQLLRRRYHTVRARRLAGVTKTPRTKDATGQ